MAEAKTHRGAKLLVVDPRYTCTASAADYDALVRPVIDIAFLVGVIRLRMENDKVQWDNGRNHTDASHLVRKGFG